MLRDRKLISEIRRKLSRILFDESRHPNKYEQHISSIYSFIAKDIEKEISMDRQTEKPSTLAQIRAVKQEQRENPLSMEPRKTKQGNDPEL